MHPSQLNRLKSSIKKNSEVNLQRKQGVKKVEARIGLGRSSQGNLSTLYDTLYGTRTYNAKSLSDKLDHHEDSAKSQHSLRNKNKTNDLVSRLNSTRKGKL